MSGDEGWVVVGAGKANWVELAKEAGNSRRVGQKAVRGDSDRIKVTHHHLNFQELGKRRPLDFRVGDVNGNDPAS